MDCPYVECNYTAMTPVGDECPKCRRVLRRCRCGWPNRPFSNFCRNCREPLPDKDTFWSCFRGSAQGLGLNRSALPEINLDQPPQPMLTFKLPSSCRSLLMQEGFLIAVSTSGPILMADITQKTVKPIAIDIGGRIVANPAICCGRLFVGVEGSVKCFYLGLLTSPEPSINLAWEVDVPGTPILSMLPVGERLFFNLALRPNNLREVRVIEDILKFPKKSELVFSGRSASICASNSNLQAGQNAGPEPQARDVHFLSPSPQGDSQIYLNTVHNEKQRWFLTTKPINGVAGVFRESPVAVMGGKLIAIFGENKILGRVNIPSAQFELQISAQTDNFALNGIDQLLVDNVKGPLFRHKNMQLEWNVRQRPGCDPLIFRNQLAVLGMQMGEVIVYRWDNPNIQRQANTTDFTAGAPITAMAACGSVLAVGNEAGEVKLFKFV